MSDLCSRCGVPQDRSGQSYCRDCNVAYQRERRRSARESALQTRRKALARARARLHIRRPRSRRSAEAPSN